MIITKSGFCVCFLKTAYSFLNQSCVYCRKCPQISSLNSLVLPMLSSVNTKVNEECGVNGLNYMLVRAPSIVSLDSFLSLLHMERRSSLWRQMKPHCLLSDSFYLIYFAFETGQGCSQTVHNDSVTTANILL